MTNNLVKSDQHIDYILLDCSSSMSHQWIDVCQSLNSYISALSSNHVVSHFILHPFYSANPDHIHREGALTDWTTPIDLAPSGGTSLYDSINSMGRRIAALDPPRCSIVIVTDGEDNSSMTTLDQARSILDYLRAKGYQITFIGADFANSRQAALLGANKAESLGVARRLLSDATRALATKRAAYGSTGQDIHFTPDEQQQLGGYLSNGAAQ